MTHNAQFYLVSKAKLTGPSRQVLALSGLRVHRCRCPAPLVLPARRLPYVRRYLIWESKKSRTWEHVIFIASFSSHSFRKSIITWYARRIQEGRANMFGSGTSPTALSNRQSIHTTTLRSCSG